MHYVARLDMEALRRNDPQQAERIAAGLSGVDPANDHAMVGALTAINPIFGSDLPARPDFIRAVTNAFQELRQLGPVAAMAALA
jgi:mannitol-1-phosphate/altronate dehydrogenase